MHRHEDVHDNGRRGEGAHRHEAELDHGREAEPDLVIPALVDERPVVLARPGHDLHVVVEDALLEQKGVLASVHSKGGSGNARGI